MSWEPTDLASTEYAIKPEPPAMSGLLYRGMRHIISGPPEALKTLVAWVIALSLLRADQQHRVGVVDLEMGPHATRRLLDDLGATADEIKRIVYVNPDEKPTEQYLDLMSEVDLVIIDAAAGAFDLSGLDDNARKDAEAWARQWVRPLFDAGVATLTIDHVTKATESRGKFTIGSERKVGQADVHLGLEPEKQLTRGGSGLVKVRVHKDRGGWLQRPYACEIDFRSDLETHRITWTLKQSETPTDTDEWRPTGLMEKASKFLERQPTPVPRSDVYAHLGGKREYAVKATSFLVSDGYAQEHPGNGRTRLIGSIKPFRAERSDVPASFPNVPDPEDVERSHVPPVYRRGTGNVTPTEEPSDDGTEANDAHRVFESPPETSIPAMAERPEGDGLRVLATLVDRQLPSLTGSVPPSTPSPADGDALTSSSSPSREAEDTTYAVRHNAESTELNAGTTRRDFEPGEIAELERLASETEWGDGYAAGAQHAGGRR